MYIQSFKCGDLVLFQLDNFATVFGRATRTGCRCPPHLKAGVSWALGLRRLQTRPQGVACRRPAAAAADMEPPVQVFRGEPGPTCSPSTCLPPNGSGRLPGWAEAERNGSAGPEDAPPEPAHISPLITAVITAVYSVVFVVGLVGNSLVMFVIVRYTKMKTATNIYIFNLALADALVTTTMPFQSTVYLMNSWPFGDVLCKIVISIDYYNMFTSIFTLTMMSVDRYIAVCHPVKALDFRTPLKAKMINICIWILSSSVGISAIVLGGTKVREDCYLQGEDRERRHWNSCNNQIPHVSDIIRYLSSSVSREVLHF
ncbi:kappa-type opioid receptor isoform X2 [Kogia breviceps]|uniref:kappa-type opioid receptor isoform X2 n=1 Tax=Kogia breviceps TaxID=27615 RepID=UPI0034D35D68